MIRITNVSGLGRHTKVYHRDGSLLHGIENVNININQDGFVTAILDFTQTELDIEAEPLLSLESLKHFAKYYGYELKEVNNEQT